MLCDTCIYYDCEDIHCSNCKMLQHSKTIDGNNIEVCYCNKSTKCGGKVYDVNDNLIHCVRYMSKEMLFMLEETC